MIFVQKMSKELKDTINIYDLWTVHSLFKNGLNLISGNNLLFIGTDKNGSLPFALHLSFKDTKEVLKAVKVGDQFLFDSKDGRFKNSKILLSFDYAIFYESSMPQQQVLSLKQIGKVLIEAGNISEYTGFKEKMPLSLDDIKDTDFRKAIKSLISSDKDSIREGLLFFIGRGTGLTPSGDDLLVGLLSIDSAFPFLNKDFRFILLDLLETKERTTLVGETYLRYALKQLYSTTLLSFTNELSETYKGNQLKVEFKNILTNGSTSGLDTMTGILIGLLVFKERGIR